MSYLLDTDVISELRKCERCNENVRAWLSAVADEELFISVLTIGEIRKGIETIRRRDARAAAALDRWLRRVVSDHRDRIIGIDQPIAEEWGRMNAPDPLPVMDGLLAATAMVHDMTLVTRNIGDVQRTGVGCFDPFEPPVG